jgi:predicted nuclease of predicted toxin-antitoxin system
VKFVVDAQLPKSLSELLKRNGHDSVHTIELSLKNETDDVELEQVTVKENRVLVTKDSDFEDGFLLKRVPPKLILVTTGNITNKELLDLFSRTLRTMVYLLESHVFLELDREKVTVRY